MESNYYSCFFVAQSFLSDLTTGRNKLLVDYNVSDWIGVFWNGYCKPLWGDSNCTTIMVPKRFYGDVSFVANFLFIDFKVANY